MSTPSTTPPLDLDVACSLPATARAERGDDWTALLADTEEVSELGEGYAFRFPSRPEWIARAAALIVAERACCPFFSFSLVFEPGEGPVWLHILGPAEVKDFIREEMVPARFRPLLAAAVDSAVNSA